MPERVKKNTKVDNILTYGGTFILITLLTLSIWVDQRVASQGLTTPSADEILDYAFTFLRDSAHAPEGRKADCSGYTNLVFGHFKISPGVSSLEQFNASERLQANELNPGNLLFFNTNGKNVSHVAICVDSLTFIHSPGINRYVRIDSIRSTYWSKRFISGGKVKLKRN